MIYDCFVFFNELDLLDLRLNILNEIVDKFVLVEGTKNFCNQKKRLFFDENKEKFAQFKEKIIHVIVDDYPEYKTSWTNEVWLRNSIAKGIKNCNDDDIIMISDLDEIPKPEVILKVKDEPGLKALDMDFYYYFVNCKNIKTPIWNCGTKILTYSDFKHILDDINDNYSINSPQELDKGTTANKIRMYSDCKHIPGGRWHFSYLGGFERIKTKLLTGSHQEFNQSEYTDIDAIKRRVLSGKDLFDRKNYQFEFCYLDEKYPKYLLNNRDKFQNLIASNAMVKTFKINKIKNKLKNILKHIFSITIKKEYFHINLLWIKIHFNLTKH